MAEKEKHVEVSKMLGSGSAKKRWGGSHLPSGECETLGQSKQTEQRANRKGDAVGLSGLSCLFSRVLVYASKYIAPDVICVQFAAYVVAGTLLRRQKLAISASSPS